MSLSIALNHPLLLSVSELAGVFAWLKRRQLDGRCLLLQNWCGLCGCLLTRELSTSP
jgi:hypothetical protein